MLENGHASTARNVYVRPFLKNTNLRKIWLLFTLLIIFCLMLVRRDATYTEIMNNDKRLLKFRQYDGNWRNLTNDEKGKLSNLGRILYLEEKTPIQRNGEYLILFWKYGSYIKNRHLNHYTKETFDPFEDCSVKNCRLSFEDKDLNEADIVIFHLHRMKSLEDIPKNRRDLTQIWAFLTDESPYHTFLNPKTKLNVFNGKFNWSMTYRMDSDIPVPYGRTRKFMEKLGNYEIPNKRRDKLVAILGSNCGGVNHRWKYVEEMKKYIEVDVYGSCGNKTACPGHFKADCPAIDDYLFYLSFENSDCREYVTEKVYWNGYQKNSIPIIMGYNYKSYEKLLPPGSFLHVDEFAEPRDLAYFILYLNSTNEYTKYYRWKDSYEIVNEHGYFKSKSYHFCRICEALNFNDRKTKTYYNLDDFWNSNKDCSVRS